LQAISTETIYAFIFRATQKVEKLWRYLARRKASRGRRVHRSKDKITDKIHIFQRSKAANERAEPGQWEADLVICKRNRPLLVLHERKTRLASKSAVETVTAITDILAKLDPQMRRSAPAPRDLVAQAEAIIARTPSRHPMMDGKDGSRFLRNAPKGPVHICCKAGLTKTLAMP
jgi:IS30 family transposase